MRITPYGDPSQGELLEQVVPADALERKTFAMRLVAQRCLYGVDKNPLAVELQLMKRVPKEYAVDSHHWLILHGRYVCQARKPRCWECAVSSYCDYQPKTTAA